MEKKEIKKKLEEYKAAYVAKFVHNEKEYIKAIREFKDGIKYVYYEMENNDLKEIKDIDLIKYFDKLYGIKASNIIY